MCSLCDDTGWKPVMVDGVRRVVRCDCWQSEHTRRLFDEARIPPRYRHCDFDKFQVYHQNEKLAIAVAAVRRFADNFPNIAKGFCRSARTASAKRTLPSPRCAPHSRAAIKACSTKCPISCG
jgi:hypothetical protein